MLGVWSKRSTELWLWEMKQFMNWSDYILATRVRHEENQFNVLWIVISYYVMLWPITPYNIALAILSCRVTQQKNFSRKWYIWCQIQIVYQCEVIAVWYLFVVNTSFPNLMHENFSGMQIVLLLLVLINAEVAAFLFKNYLLKLILLSSSTCILRLALFAK